ncbi:MAG TPA: class I tRNA ligase family protein [Streptosporangiaceae bacterium]|nr:class I tRNA ligase family protein [Streptosporangiaceae bacterium]
MQEGTPPFRYDARLANEIELKWQDRWEREGTFQAPNPPSAEGPGAALSDGFAAVAGRPKFYLLDFFPYPSGIGLHVGHPLGYIGTDVYGRYLRMTGHNVLHPFGFDTFGLPAEQYAIDTGQHPAVTVRQNAAVMRRQLRRLGLGHDRRREILTSDPSYYRWTQWIFLLIFNSWYDQAAGPGGRARPVGDLVAEFAAGRRATPDGRAWADLSDGERRDVIDGHRLAYLAEEVVNWCPGLGTVLADEEVTDEGRSAVGNYPVYRRPLRQWMLRITAFAERLLADLDVVDWPDNVKRLQRNWIGPSGGPYRLKDWLFSRQRYWGEPFPIVYDAADPDPKPRPIALPEAMLPVTLPEMTGFRPVPQDDASDPAPALSRAPGWADITLDLGDGPRRYRRELNVMPQWAGSCWYYLRYLDPLNEAALVGREAEHYWMPPAGVDLYVGGVEHAVLHLLYARFWHKVLHDYAVTETTEPFGRLFNQGYILADAFTDARGQYVPAADVTGRADHWEYRGRPVTRRAGKMGKSLKNGVSPDDIYDSYGADTLRLYEMAMGPLDGDRAWRTDDIIGMHRFLQRLWRLIIDETTGAALVAPRPPGPPATAQPLDAATAQPLDPATARLLHQTIATVRDEFAALRFNTAIARIIELTAHASRLPRLPRDLAEPLVLMVAPLAPHVAEELWQRLGHPASLAYEPFPQADPALAAEESVTLPVQVNGKLRFTIEVPAGAGEADIAELLARHPGYPRQDVARLVIVPGKIVNVVLR